jgi:hypothetical protein
MACSALERFAGVFPIARPRTRLGAIDASVEADRLRSG